MPEAPGPPFANPYAHGFLRVGACAPPVRPADPAFNAAATLALIRRAHDEGCAVLVCPELGVSGYAIDDLLGQAALLARVRAELAGLARATASLRPLVFVGAPLETGGRLYNCAVALGGGRVLGVVPKTFLPNYREFYERRWFASGRGVTGRTVELAGEDVPFGVDLLFRLRGATEAVVHAEVCEDAWVPEPPPPVRRWPARRCF